MRIATIDVGTNAALLLVAEQTPDGRLHPLFEMARYIRLGEGVDAHRRINGAAMERLRTTLLAYRAQARAWHAGDPLVAGTSASRDAENRDELVAFVRRETGLRYRILSGEEEARLSFLGAASAFDDLEGPCIVIDIGGGSTEVILGTPGHPPSYRCSLDVGAVRLTERFMRPLPAAPEALAAAEAFARHQIATLPVAPYPLIGAAGTTTALALLHHGTPTRPLAAADVRAWRARLLPLTPDDVLALNPAVLGGRADVFPAGVLLLDLLMQHLGAPACRISPWDLRHGMALHFFRTSTPPGALH